MYSTTKQAPANVVHRCTNPIIRPAESIMTTATRLQTRKPAQGSHNRGNLVWPRRVSSAAHTTPAPAITTGVSPASHHRGYSQKIMVTGHAGRAGISADATCVAGLEAVAAVGWATSRVCQIDYSTARILTRGN